jgi:hypothetical protein
MSVVLRIDSPESDLLPNNNWRHLASRTLLLLSLLLLTGCFTDAATRIANDIEAAAKQVGHTENSQFTLAHLTPSKKGECDNSYKVQLDKVGALIIWCKEEKNDQTVSSYSTSYHSRFVDTPDTYILEKNARETLFIELERRNGRVVITDVK